MASIPGRRMMAEIDGDFVVFLIGARFNSFHLLQTFRDLGGRRGMKHMLDYLTAHPDKGLLGYQMGDLREHATVRAGQGEPTVSDCVGSCPTAVGSPATTKTETVPLLDEEQSATPS